MSNRKEQQFKQSKQDKDKKKHKRDESSSSKSSCDDCIVNDEVALAIQAQWKKAFSDASLLPVIGLPSNGNGVGTLTHTMGDGHFMRINGLISKSPLSNNALYSFECAESEDDSSVVKYLNEYEIMIPDIPGRNGHKSTGEYYVKLLAKYGLSVAGVHFHWWGQNVVKGNTLVAAVHHQGIDISPEDFSRKTIRAIQKTVELIDKRTKNGDNHGKKH